MKRYLVISLFLMLFSLVTTAQNGKIAGTITDSESGKAVPNATITVSGIKTVTDANGYFEITSLKPGSYNMEVIATDYDPFSLTLDIKENTNLQKSVSIKKSKGEVESPGLSEVNLSAVEQEQEDENKDQNISGLLHASNDVFASTAGFTFSGASFRVRGYDSENSYVSFNGIGVSNPENGRPNWSDWSGLNDATRVKELSYGLTPADNSFGAVGGMTDINTRASLYRKQIKLSYALSNRTYNNRIMLTYATGPLKGGWAFMVSASRRWAKEGYVDGTFYDYWGYFVAAEKKFGTKHSIALTAFGSPSRRGMQGASTQEAYDLAGTNFYNPNWGLQNGEKRNAKVRTAHEPILNLTHYWNISKNTKLTTNLMYYFGRNSSTSLNWYNSRDPRPDYYRYLPGYTYITAPNDSLTRAIMTNNWQNDINTRQLNWDYMYQSNYLSNMYGQQARYIIEENVTGFSQIALNSFVNSQVNKNIKISGGLDARTYNARHYKIINDLLGGNYWVDVDQFAERDFREDSMKMQNDLNNPSRVVKKGDVFGYDYEAHINQINLWGQSEFSFNKVDFYASASLTGLQYWRTGNMRNGRHPDNSYGNSAKQTFLNVGVKAGLTYKITGRHFIDVNGVFMTRAPYFYDTYISPKTRDDVLPVMKNELVYGGDINYNVRYPWLKARLTLYATRFTNQSKISTFYQDDYKTFGSYVMTGIDATHEGIEFGAEVKATKMLSFTGVASIGQYFYTSRPSTLLTFDNGIVPDTTFTTYMKNFNLSGTPQTALSLGLKFNYDYWFFNFNANYFGNIWLDFNPERRTEAAVQNLTPGDPLIALVTQQRKLNGGFTFDASIGKSILIKRKFYININFSVSNIFNNTDLQTGGYEQMRFVSKDFVKGIDNFDPKYFYMYGRTFFLNLSFRI